MFCIFLILKNNNELPTTKRTACQDNILRSVFVFDDVMIFVSNHVTVYNKNLHQTGCVVKETLVGAPDIGIILG